MGHRGRCLFLGGLRRVGADVPRRRRFPEQHLSHGLLRCRSRRQSRLLAFGLWPQRDLPKPLDWTLKLSFKAFFLVISALCYLYLWWRLVGVFPGGQGGRLLVSLVFIGLFVLGMLATPHVGDGGRTGWRKLAVSSFYFWLVTALLGCLLFGARDVIWWTCSGVELIFDVDILPAPASRSNWLHQSNLALLVVLFLVSAWSNYSAHRAPRIRRLTIRFPDLPRDLHGFRIVHLTDLHLGPYVGLRAISSVVQRVNSEKPDMVAITGDVVDGPVDVWADTAQPLGSLRSTYGTFVVLGNHDYYSGAEDWIGLLSELGARVLVNSTTKIDVGSCPLRIIGITDPVAERILPEQSPNLEAATADLATGELSILLAHRPEAVQDAGGKGVALQLSGHTHGGQIFPFGLLARRHQAGLLAGLYDVGGTKLYVNRGVGFWGPAMRFLAPSEIAVITLSAS